LIARHSRSRMKIDLERMRKIRAVIRRDIETKAWNVGLEAYTQSFGGAEIDANALLLAYHGFEEAKSERMQKTYRRIRERLQPRRGLLFRDQRSLEKGEGAFALCGFWEVDFLARAGQHKEAQEVFEAAMAYA